MCVCFICAWNNISTAAINKFSQRKVNIKENYNEINGPNGNFFQYRKSMKLRKTMCFWLVFNEIMLNCEII